MLVAYVRYALFVLLPLYFFVPLGVGLLWLLLFRRGPGANSGVLRFRWIAWCLVALGVWGGFRGVPHYYGMIQHERAARAHFESACATKAVVELPRSSFSARGIVWMGAEQALRSFLSRRDHYGDFIGPGQGQYMELEQPHGNSFSAAVWDDTNSLFLGRPTKSEIRSSATLPFEVRTRPVTSPEDSRYRVEGVETRIIDRASGAAIARRVVYARMSNDPINPLAATCPKNAIAPGDCDLSGCSVIPFVVAAVKPQLPPDLSKAFHLYAGSGSRRVPCSFLINFGPGVKESEVQWWWEDHGVVIGTRGTSDRAVCEGYGGLLSSYKFHFHDSGRTYVDLDVKRADERPTKANPRALVGPNGDSPARGRKRRATTIG